MATLVMNSLIQWYLKAIITIDPLVDLTQMIQRKTLRKEATRLNLLQEWMVALRESI